MWFNTALEHPCERNRPCSALYFSPWSSRAWLVIPLPSLFTWNTFPPKQQLEQPRSYSSLPWSLNSHRHAGIPPVGFGRALLVCSMLRTGACFETMQGKFLFSDVNKSLLSWFHGRLDIFHQLSTYGLT